jgi:hypothetical protein
VSGGEERRGGGAAESTTVHWPHRKTDLTNFKESTGWKGASETEIWWENLKLELCEGGIIVMARSWWSSVVEVVSEGVGGEVSTNGSQLEHARGLLTGQSERWTVWQRARTLW